MKGSNVQNLKCTKCKQEKLPEEMSKDARRRGGLSSWCRECRKVSARTWGSKNPDKVKEQYRLKKNKEGFLEEQRSRTLKSRYGIDQQQYNDLLEYQKFKCAICKTSSEDKTYLFHVDHCHTTGKVRGLLCAPCNVYLGYIKDCPEIYMNGIEYLNEREERKIWKSSR